MKTRSFLALILATALPVATGCASNATVATPDDAKQVAQNELVEREMTEEEKIESFSLPDPMMAAPGQMEMSWEPTEEPEEKAARPKKAAKPYTVSDKKRPRLFVIPTKYEE